MERRLGVLRDLGTDLLGGAHRHRALGDDRLGLVHVLADRACDGQDVLEVGGAVLVGRRADGDDHDVGALDRRPDVRGELEAPSALIAGDERLEPRLVDREPVLLQAVDLPRVDVGARNVVPRLREAGADDQPDVPRSDDGDFHVTLPARGKTCRVSTTARACRATSP